MKATEYRTQIKDIKQKIIYSIIEILNNHFNGRWDLTDDDGFFDELKEETELYEILWLLKSIYTEDNKLFAVYEDSDNEENVKSFTGELMNLDRLVGWLERLENKLN